MKTALVLSGGGAKGSMQFGFIKYLFEQGFCPDAVYGTSVGSLNGAGLAFKGVEGLENVWVNIKSKSDVFKFNYLSLLFLAKGLYNAKPLHEIVEKSCQGEPQLDSYACKVNLISGEIKYVHCKESDYIDSVVASSSIPAFTEPIGEWVDGGVREQAPLKRAIKDGADKIVVIMCNPLVSNPPPGEIGNWTKNLLRTTDILSHEVFLNDIQNCIWYNNHPELGKKQIKLEVYAPEKLVIDSLDFTQDKIQPAIQYGYEQAKKGPLSIEYIDSL